MEIIGEHSSLSQVFKIVDKVAPTDSTVLVTGESGTGKELLVRALHNRSNRANKPFIPVNCGAIPKDLLESELFGHEKGSFTGAMNTKLGRFELAEGGTIFLDEIGEMDMSLQVKILRTLQEKEIERVGGCGPRKVDVRIVAATNRDLEIEVEKGRFREDLYYRLNVIPIHLPPLRERVNDILPLIQHFLAYFCTKKVRPTLQLSALAQQIFLAYPWNGNVRELENFMERLSILVDGNTIEVEDIPAKILNAVGDIADLPPIPEELKNIPLIESKPSPKITPSAKDLQSILNPKQSVETQKTSNSSKPSLLDLQASSLGLKEFLETIENAIIDEALEESAFVKNQAADLLGIKRTTLIEKLKKRNID